MHWSRKMGRENAYAKCINTDRDIKSMNRCGYTKWSECCLSHMVYVDAGVRFRIAVELLLMLLLLCWTDASGFVATTAGLVGGVQEVLLSAPRMLERVLQVERPSSCLLHPHPHHHLYQDDLGWSACLGSTS